MFHISKFFCKEKDTYSNFNTLGLLSLILLRIKGLVLLVLEILRSAGTDTLLLNSAIGVTPAGRFLCFLKSKRI